MCGLGPGCEKPAAPPHSALSPPGSDSPLAGSAGRAAFGPSNPSHLEHLERAVAAGGAISWRSARRAAAFGSDLRLKKAANRGSSEALFSSFPATHFLSRESGAGRAEAK